LNGERRRKRSSARARAKAAIEWQLSKYRARNDRPGAVVADARQRTVSSPAQLLLASGLKVEFLIVFWQRN
jgi:hypothetical protein